MFQPCGFSYLILLLFLGLHSQLLRVLCLHSRIFCHVCGGVLHTFVAHFGTFRRNRMILLWGNRFLNDRFYDLVWSSVAELMKPTSHIWIAFFYNSKKERRRWMQTVCNEGNVFIHAMTYSQKHYLQLYGQLWYSPNIYWPLISYSYNKK